MGKHPRSRKGNKNNRHKRRRGGRARQGGPARFSGPSLDELVGQLEEALAEGRTRRAVALATVIEQRGEIPTGIEDPTSGLDTTGHREQVDPPDGFSTLRHLTPILAAHARHMREMTGRGHSRKAVKTYVEFERKHPAWIPHLAIDFRLEMELQGGSTSLLCAYERDARTRASVDSHLSASLRDIRLLAEHPLLPERHELRQGAGLIVRAWQAVENEEPGWSEHLTAMMKGVGRRSPLVGWRLFVQALAAFYARQDESATEALTRIPESAGAAPLAAILRDLIAGRPGPGRGGAIVAAHLQGDPLKSRLAEADTLIAVLKWREAWETVHHLAKEFDEVRARPQLQRLIGGRFIGSAARRTSGISPDQLGPPLGDRDSVLHFLAHIQFDTVEDWQDFLRRQGGGLSTLELALVYAHLGHLCSRGDLADAFFDQDDESVFLEAAERWWEKSVAAHPLRSTYMSWFKAALAADRRLGEKVLLSWHLDFPEDDVPLGGLVAFCRERGVFQKAAGFFRKLDRLAAGRPDVETLRVFLAADNAVRHLRANRNQKAREEIESMPAVLDLHAGIIRDVLRAVLLVRENRADEAEAGIHGARHPFLTAMAAQVCLGRGVREAECALRVAWRRRGDVEAIAADFHAFTRVRDSIWAGWQRPALLEPLVASLQRTTMASEAMRECLEYLCRIDPDRSAPADLDLSRALTANGIRRRDSLLPVFLCYRALVLDSHASALGRFWLDRSDERVVRCLHLAWQIASEAGKTQEMRFVESIAHRILGSKDLRSRKKLTPAQIEKVLQKEGRIENDGLPRRKGLPGARRGSAGSRREYSEGQAELF